MEEQLQQAPAQAPAQTQQPEPPPAPPSQGGVPMAQGKHTHASVWLLGILFVLTLLTLVAASIYFIQSNANLMREADIERQEKQDALTMLEEKETEALELAQELESSEISEDAFIAYGGLISSRDVQEFSSPEEYQSQTGTHLGSMTQEWSEQVSCTALSSLNDSFDRYNPNTELWADETFLAQVRDLLSVLEDPEVALTAIINRDAADEIPIEVCSTTSGVYTTFDDVGNGWVRFWESGSEQTARDFQPITTVVGFTLYPEVLDGHSVAVSVYGDAGRTSSGIYILDKNTFASTLVEACYGGLATFDPETNVETSDFACDLEYVPLEDAMGASMMEVEDDSMVMEEDSMIEVEN